MRPAPGWRSVIAIATSTLLVLGVTAACGGATAAPARPATVPTGFGVTPAGTQTDLGDLPLDAALSPDRSTLAVVNAGQATQSVQLVEAATGRVTQTLPYPNPKAVFTGVAFSPDGRTLFVSGGGQNLVRRYGLTNGQATEGPSIPLPTTSPTGAPIQPFPSGLAVTPDGTRLVVADQQADAVSVVDLASGAVTTTGAGHRPRGVAVSPDGRTAWVADEGGTTVAVVDLSGAVPAQTGSVAVGTHPNTLVRSADGRTLYAADGDSDQVSVIDTASRAVSRTFSLAPYPNAPVGTNPDGLALSPDERTLYVANAGNNDVAVLDTTSGQVRGLIPTAWYPTAVVAGPNGLLVANGKGLGAGPNVGPGEPDPTQKGSAAANLYSGSMIVGTLSSIPVPDDATLAQDTAAVGRNDDLVRGADVRSPGGPGEAVIPIRPGQASPIKHVIYIVKENRTYDQEFGSLGQGNGDPAIDLFGDESAPNLRAAERQFVTLDNFYADAEVSAQGWNWSVAANSNPYAEAVWPSNYSDRNAPYPSESGDPATAPNRDPADAYIWDRLGAANIPFRNYGFYVDHDTKTNQNSAADPVLNASTDHAYRGFDLKCPDAPNTFVPLDPTCGPSRFEQWQSEFTGYVAGGNLPTMELLRFPNDHTASTKPGSPTPRAYVADNDLAVGKVVDAVSHSPYWNSTAIFVTEDDAQNGPDHVDAHRTTSEVISPYSRTGKVDSTFYSTASMLRTMELIVGLRPLTQFDAYATPMIGAFTTNPNAAPYTALVPSQNPREVNTPASPMATPSAMQDFSVEDRIDMATVNQAVWQSVRGAGSVMPAPVHHVFAPPPTTNGAPAGDGDDDGDGH
ncbi:SMP-30/gluconolactonase/LRE family protein [Actinomycetospora chiangmaiensis]|uniref:SMP-30/gluconolactonase/LRE family protein n=1 Tax=Actinomycetospora chiangmaiensis TaxID=402650 RepID=UPI0003795B31|nr:SMP-30/gluconolactonase/LRE family protein [Actinomycetospora chiangmaiensis]